VIVKFDNYELISESPDTVYYKHKELHCEDNDAQPFVCDVNDEHTNIIQVFVREPGRYHGNLGEKDCENDLAYKGRLWSKAKIISFWVYPMPEVFKQII